jgi:hypothetical protein
VVALITEIMRFSISPEADADELLLWVDLGQMTHGLDTRFSWNLTSTIDNLQTIQWHTQ